MSAVTNVQHTEFVNILCYIKLESSQGVPLVWNIVGNKVSMVQLWLKHVRCEKKMELYHIKISKVHQTYASIEITIKGGRYIIYECKTIVVTVTACDCVSQNAK